MPKLNERQAEDHPWRFKVTPKVQKRVWTCPNCGESDCEYEECLAEEDARDE